MIWLTEEDKQFLRSMHIEPPAYVGQLPPGMTSYFPERRPQSADFKTAFMKGRQWRGMPGFGNLRECTVKEYDELQRQYKALFGIDPPPRFGRSPLWDIAADQQNTEPDINE